jgi:CubicO group peptidase (beta-lactamase class C family)
MRKILLVAVIAAALAFNVRADKVDRAVKELMRTNPIPGVALEVIRDGKCIKRTGYGYGNLEWKTKVTPETVFEIGSCTKQFTAAGVMLLVQDGKVKLDDPVSVYLKDTPPSWKNITVRNLLTHTSGIPNYTVLDGFELRRHLTQAGFIKQIGSYPLDFQPGDGWKYCNSAFNLAAYIIENVSGSNYWDYMHDRIFGPLGMTSTTNRVPINVIPLRASGYETDKTGKYINRDYDLTDLSGAGAIISTVDDLAKWNASLDNKKLLTEASEEEIWTPVKLNNGKTHAYGFGWFLSPLEGHENIGHSGSTSGFSASIQRFPKDGLAVIVLTNSNEDGVATKIAKAVALLYLKKSDTGK